ncbi:alpha/beta hydrolase [Crocinitomicaceae bacterium]|nr:alpha/beta hydrolase [Crocinitomicaceae bacterium]MDB3906117.1 alpha/beta hydrolase [Crocinitomicaceae bacterium]
MLNYSTYRNENSQQWVTFLHGAGGSSSIWFKQIKSFSQSFNLLLIDLRGHGKSKNHISNISKSIYTFDAIADEVIEVLDYLKITTSHFLGISLGTIVIRTIAEKSPERVKSMIMGGAVLKLNFRSRFLMSLGNTTKSILPYMWMYKMFAFIIMPNRNHKESRLMFIREAKKLYQKEFNRWFKLTSEVVPLLRVFRQKSIGIPTLYVMGEQDYMFLPSVRKVVKHHQEAVLQVIPNCGHVVNIENPQLFNKITLNYLQRF